MSSQDQALCQLLREHPQKYGFRYTKFAGLDLLKILFTSIANGNDQHLSYFFPHGPPPSDEKPWSLAEAQGAVSGSEYTEAARGKRCGHIFRNGEATYSCRTCTVDDTCVLCTKCFDASDHDGHQVYISMSSGTTGCCDCGDAEAWIRPVSCSIHTALPQGRSNPTAGNGLRCFLPDELQESIRVTIARAIDYLCDVFSCAPEHMRVSKNEHYIRQNEELSRLKSKWYRGTDQSEQDKEFALLLWNDEKHTWEEVKEQVARACRKKRTFGLEKAMEVDGVGRSVVEYSRDLKGLLRKAAILEEIKLTVTIRSSRDTFREQMCSTIIEWLSDIAGCSVGDDHHILIHVICEEMLKPWRVGSDAFNLEIGTQGIVDEQKSDERLVLLQQRSLQRRMHIAREAARLARVEVGMVPPRAVLLTPAGRGRLNDDLNNVDEEEVIEDEQDQAEDNGLDNDDNMEFDGTIREAAEDADVVTAAEIAFGILGAPPSPPQIQPTPDDSDDEVLPPPALLPQRDPIKLIPRTLPRTPKANVAQTAAPPGYWFETQKSSWTSDTATGLLPVHEDLDRRVRIDFLILYDLRMWKKLRNDLRHLYISTVVTIPSFKRILGLRFAALYTCLAQLYLIADREPDHSIINLSLQMLTTPSITAEIVERGRFFTRLLAILYTFLTKRQVGNPEEVDPTAMMALETGVMANRRIYQFFSDMRYLLDSKFVQEKIRTEDEYLYQFLDFIKLYQGICPNFRAVAEHLEYESDAWISASFIVKEVTRIIRQFCESFKWTRLQDPARLCRAIRQTAKATIINSLGCEHQRFIQAEIKAETKFKNVYPYEFEVKTPGYVLSQHIIVDFVVEKEPMSFHHTLHYTLSWLINSGKSMSRHQLQGLLEFTQRQLQLQDSRSSIKPKVPLYDSQHYLLALFDIPLRVSAWLAQMRAGMWVRNGITLRHQASTFRSVAQRDLSHQRDLFLLQVALVTCPPTAMLASVIDRFGMGSWMRGPLFKIPEGYEDHQMVDLLEDMIHLLVVLLSDRTLLHPTEDQPLQQGIIAKRDIAHVLCFKSLSYSELTERLPNKVRELEDLPSILQAITNFRAPEGLSDSGTFELQDQCYEQIDPYNAYYSRNHREEAEFIYRSHVAKRTGKPLEEVVFEPQLQPIRSGIFTDIASFTQIPLFGQVVSRSLSYVLVAEDQTPGIPRTRVETFLQIVLHLILLVILEDSKEAGHANTQQCYSFTDMAMGTRLIAVHDGGLGKDATILDQLFMLLDWAKVKHVSPASKAKIQLVIRRLRDKNPHSFALIVSDSGVSAIDSNSSGELARDLSIKKKQALERQARVMASFRKQQNDFLENQSLELQVEDSCDSDSEMAATVVPVKMTTNFPSGTCIFCQEDTNDQRLYGTLALIAQSNILRSTNLKDGEYIGEVCTTPCSLDRSAEAIRPFGVASQNVQDLLKVAADGNLVKTERRGLGKGFPSTHHRPGPVVTSCGHIMHYSCFETYNAATQRRQSYQVARNHPERLSLKEFVCPLCKALGNVFLPIIWKPKEIASPPTLPVGAFEQWLTVQAPFQVSQGLDFAQYKKSLTKFGLDTLVPPLVEKLHDLGRPSLTSSPLSTSSTSRWQLPAFLNFNDPRSAPGGGTGNVTNSSLDMSELVKSYCRLRETMKTNHLWSHFQSPQGMPDILTNADTIAKAMAFSVSAAEIAQRGAKNEIPVEMTASLQIPQQLLTHLRILAETTSSYVAIASLHTLKNDLRITSSNFHDNIEIPNCCSRQIQQLFGGARGLVPHSNPQILTPLFSEDLFIFFAECSFFSIPYHRLDVYHVMRLCYFAEIVKVVFTILHDSSVAAAYAQMPLEGADAEMKQHCSSEEGQNFSAFVQAILLQSRNALTQNNPLDTTTNSIDDNPNSRYRFDHFLRAAVLSYALPFLRKSALLLHVRYGIEFSTVDSYSSISSFDTLPELARLSQALGLPAVDEIVRSFISDAPASRILQRLSLAWITHWTDRSKRDPTTPKTLSAIALRRSPRSLELRLPHPAIFELVALPDTHDALNAEAMARRCPTTGRELSDPCVCLFCGAVFCGQATCCARSSDHISGEGGCYRHQAVCGGSIGMYLNIRKCVVLLLNGRNGSWTTAPYLDRYGEVADAGLRRKHQLFLSRRRFDKGLRDVWLWHGIQSAISRRLEGDVNTGGWETT